MLKQIKSKILNQFSPALSATLPSKVNLATPFMQIKKQKFEYFGRGGKNLFLLKNKNKRMFSSFTCGVRSIIDLIYKTKAFLWLDSSNLHICACFSAEGYYSK